jgi:hypothetical protein
VRLKDAIADDAQLRRFDASLYTEVQCDASLQTMGAVLLQGPDPEHLHVLEYASKVLTPAQQNYSNTERELYAIRWAVTDKFRPYLEGRKFTVATDHQALLHEMQLNQPSRRIVYFKLQLESYNYTLRHIKGKQNLAADALSRVPAKPTVASHPDQKEHVAVLQTPKRIWDPREQRQIIDQCHKQLGHAGWRTVLQTLRTRFV